MSRGRTRRRLEKHKFFEIFPKNWTDVGTNEEPHSEPSDRRAGRWDGYVHAGDSSPDEGHRDEEDQEAGCCAVLRMIAAVPLAEHHRRLVGQVRQCEKPREDEVLATSSA